MTAQLATGTAQRVLFDIPGTAIAALQTGEPGRGDVLLVPGYTGSKEDFGPILEAIACAGYRVTAIDLPGQYESPARTDLADYAPDALGGDVCAVSQLLGEPIHLVGHSFGGLVARAAVLARTRLFASLVLMGSGPSEIHGQRRAAIEQLEPVLATAGMSGVYDAMQARVAAQADYVEPPAALAQFLRERFLASSPVMLAGMGHALCTEPDRVADLAAAALPMLVLYGERDDAWPTPIQRQMADRLGASRVVIADAAHSPAVENPAATSASLIDFWRSLP